MHIIDGNNLTVENSVNIIKKGLKLKLSPASAKKIKASRKLVDEWISKDEIIYGITTGFGEFKNVKISKKDSGILQHNLITSHTAGVGEFIPDDSVRLMLLFRLNSLAKGFSGVRLELIEFLIKFFNSCITPLIHSQGSVGSSGDLSPLSELALAYIGEGKCRLNGKIYSAKDALKKCGMQTIQIWSKEGLALINGTQMMAAYTCFALYDAINLCKLADIAGAMSLDAMKGIENAFDEKIHKARPHK